VIDGLLGWLTALPAGAIYVVVALLAAVENIFPPVPADTAVAIGAFISGSGRVWAPAIFLLTWVANVAGAAGMYFAARRLGRRFKDAGVGRRLLNPDSLARIQALYASYGTWGIFLSRFIPAARAVVPPFAGIAGLSAPRALIPMAIASGLWYGALTFLVARYVNEIHDVVRFVDRLSTWTLAGAGMVALVIVVIVLARKRTTVSRPGGE